MTIAVFTSPVMMNWRATCIAYRNPEHAAAMSKHVAFLMPSAGWMIADVAGIGCSTVAVASTSSSISSGSTPASAIARLPASTAIVATLSPSLTTWRSRMPVRETIHSSEVSTILSKSLLVKIFSGRQVPKPAMRAVSACRSCTLDPLRCVAGAKLADLGFDVADDPARGVSVGEADGVPDRICARARVAHQARPAHAEQRRPPVLGVVRLALEGREHAFRQQHADRRLRRAPRLAAQQGVDHLAQPLGDLEHDVAHETVADHHVHAAVVDVAPLDVADEVQPGIGEQAVRLDRHAVALALLLADREQADARVRHPQHRLRVEVAHDGELLQVLRFAVDVRADVEDQGLAGESGPV